MRRVIRLWGLAMVPALATGLASGETPSETAREVAGYARATYAEASVDTLQALVGFRTVHQEGVENARNREFQAMTGFLERKADELGLRFADHGAVVVISHGDAQDRLGLVTHGDVQPADPSKWAEDPFTLDGVSEPGRLLGRGVEDDKGPIATCLYAMKALKDRRVPLRRRIELIISYTEESDWEAFGQFLADHPPPKLNVAIDAEYPVVTAEKGWGTIHLSLPDDPDTAPEDAPRLVSLRGGAFLSQVPEDAEATIAPSDPALEEKLRERATQADPGVRYDFERTGQQLVIRARGLAAHSSKPWDGRNAITHLAALLGSHAWSETAASRMVRLINDLVGTGDHAERFGDLAYSHPFMGRLTLTLATLGLEDGRLVAGISLRRPAGRSREDVEESIQVAVHAWRLRTGNASLEMKLDLYDPHYPEDAPHIPVLLGIFQHYTGRENAEPISIGGGTHARLVPNGVNFGPGMPDETYTGHTEHEFMTRDQLLLNLEMQTAMLVELAGR